MRFKTIFLSIIFTTSFIYAQGGLDCIPDILDIQINSQTVEFGGTINVELNSLDETFQIRLRGKNIGTDNCPSPYNDMTISFVQFNESTDKNRVSFSTFTDSDFDENLYFGSEAGGGDAYADYVMYEAVDNNYWQAGELNAVFLNVKPKNWGEFVIKFRMGLGTDESYNNYNYDPSGGYIGNDDPNSNGDCLGFESYKITVNIVQTPQYGDLTVEVKNVESGSSNYPGDNGRVQLYENGGLLVATEPTDATGKAYFSNIEEGNGYYYKVYHTPDDPENIFGEEYWGQKDNVTINGNETTYSEFVRNMPYGQGIKVYKDGEEVTGQSVAPGTELEFRVTATNPNANNYYVRTRLVLDRNKSESYDYDGTSSGQTIYGNNGERTYTFYVTLNEAGDYYSTFSTQTDVDGGYRTTDGWLWSEEPIITIEKQYGDLDVTVKNIDGSSTPYPADNGRVELFNSNNDFIEANNTDANGVAHFTHIESGNGYNYKVYHNPNDPGNIFGEEYWGKKTDVTIEGNQPNSSEFTRNMPYGESDGIKVFYNGEEVTYGAIPAGREVEFQVTVINPNVENKTSRVRLVIDQDKASSYDYDHTSDPKTISSNNGKTIYTFSVTLNSVGDYFAVINTQTNVDGTYLTTDGWAWQDKPIITVENSQSTINFAGMTWHVKEGPSLSPGPNNFSSSTNSVWVDGDGNLHLKVRKIGDRWYCSEIYTDDFMEHAEYTFYVSSNVENYDPNIVAGMFLYENDDEELDIEFSRWGDSNQDPGWYIVQPSETSGNSHGFQLNLNGDYSTHKFTWRNDRIDFQSYHGHYSEIPDPPEDYLIEEWSYTGDDNPEDNGQKRLHLNFWLHNGSAPINDQEAEFIVKDVLISHPEGSVNFYVEDQFHSFKEGALIRIYLDDGTTVTGVTNESGAYFFQHLPVGTHSYDVYNQEESGPEQELWGSGNITINENQSDLYTHTRDYPYVADMYGYQNGENVYPGQEVAAGSHIEIRFDIKNDVTWSGFDTRVTMYLDRDMADPMDNEQQQTQYIDASSSYTFSFPFDIPVDWGGSEIHIKGIVESYINGSWQQTDLVDWSEYEPFYVGADTVSPELTETYPADGEVVKLEDAVDVTIVFSEKVKEETVNANTFYVEHDSIKIPGTITKVQGVSETYKFTPDEGFKDGYNYKCTVTTGVTDLSGNPMLKDSTWAFVVTSKEKVVYSVPYYYQGGSSWCWANSTAMLLRFYGFNEKPWEIAAEDAFNAPYDEGQRIEDVQNFLNDNYNNGENSPWKTEHYETSEELKTKIISVLNMGHILYLSNYHWNGPFDPGTHAVVITGYSTDSVWVNDPSGALFYETANSSNDLIHHKETWDDFFNILDEFFTLGEKDCAILYTIENSFNENHKLVTLQISHNDYFGDNNNYFYNSMDNQNKKLEYQWDGEESDFGYYYKTDNTNWYPTATNQNLKYKATQADILHYNVGFSNHTNPFIKLKRVLHTKIIDELNNVVLDTLTEIEMNNDKQMDDFFLDNIEMRIFSPGTYIIKTYLINENNELIEDSIKTVFELNASEYAGLEVNLLDDPYQQIVIGDIFAWEIKITNEGTKDDFFDLEVLSNKTGEFYYNDEKVTSTSIIQPGESVVVEYVVNSNDFEVGANEETELIITSNNDKKKWKTIKISFEIINDLEKPYVIYNTTENIWENENTLLDIDFFDNHALDSMWYQIDSNDDSDPANWHPLTSDGINTLPESQDNPGKEMTTDWKISNEDWDNLPLNNENQGWHHIYFKVSDDAGNVYITPNQEEAFTFGKDEDPPDVRFTYPEEGQVLNETTVEVHWSSNDVLVGLELSGVANHYIAMDQNENFIELPGNQFSYTFTDLSEGSHTAYLYAIDNAGNVSETETVNFEINTSIHPPNAFNLISPEKGTETTNLQPTFRWEETTDPDGTSITYELHYAYNSEYENETVVGNLTTNQYTPDSPLEDNSTLYWKVKAIDGDGQVTWSNQLDWYFYLNQSNEPPLSFNLVDPEDEITVSTLTPTFTWTNSSDNDPNDEITYTLWVGTDVNYSAGNYDEYSGIEGTSYTLSDPLNAETKYYWKVKAVDNHGASTWANEQDRWFMTPEQHNSAPNLTYTGESGFESDGVNPDEGVEGSTFEFRIKYTDVDGDDPKEGYPVVHIFSNGSEISGSPFVMSAVNSAPVTDGRIYTYSTSSLTASDNYSYQFEAQDVNGAAAEGEGTTSQSGPIVTESSSGDKGLIAFWNFDNGQAIDVTGNGHDGTVHGATFVSGYSGQGVQFSSGDYIEIQMSSDLEAVTSGPHTFVCFMNISEVVEGQDHYAIFADNQNNIPGNEPRGILIDKNSQSNVSFALVTDQKTLWARTGDRPMDTWMMITGTFDGDFGKIYKNDIFQEKVPLNEPMEGDPTSITRFSIGGSSEGNNSFIGILDEVRVYNYILSDEQVDSLYDSYFNPKLTWSGEEGYETDGVNPDSGTVSETFIFRVKYIDPQGDAPAEGYPKLHLSKAGTEINSSPFTMNEANSEPFTSGRIYTYSISSLEIGNDYTYWFEAQDVNGTIAGGQATMKQDGPVVLSSPPELTFTGESGYESDGVNPDEATEGSTFEFRIKYTDADGEEPGEGYPVVHIFDNGTEISGSPFAMSAVNSDPVTDGRIYTYSTSSLTASDNYSYRFEAQDVSGAVAEGEGTNSKNGPIVTENTGGGSDSLVAYWSFDDGTATDNSGNGNNGTFKGGDSPLSVEGVSGNALQFNGNCYIQIENLSEGLQQFPSREHSYSCWVYLEEAISGNKYITDAANPSADPPLNDQRGIRFEGTQNVVSKWVTQDGVTRTISKTNLQLNQWYHICAVNNGNTGKIYIDGIEDTSMTISAWGGEITNFFIGATSGGGGGFAGRIDELKLFNKALSPSEINELANINNAPSLTYTGETGYESDGVNPDTLLENKTATFRVKYSDPHGDAPAEGYPKLYIFKNGNAINGSPFEMAQADTESFSVGRIYTIDIDSLKEGDDYTYKFEAKDVNGFLAFGEATQEKKGPVIKKSKVSVSIKIFLQGPFETDTMRTDLFKRNFIPLSQPFNQSPWNYDGNESVSVIPDSVVDWLLLELRKETVASSKVSSRAVFLKSDGHVIDTSGTAPVFFEDVAPDSYYIVINHRNHLSVMSNKRLMLNVDTITIYDFTTGQEKAYGENSLVELNDSTYGMYGGDANANGQIQNDDKNDYWKNNVGTAGYKASDFNLNGEVQNDDKNDIWKNNVGLGTHVDTQVSSNNISVSDSNEKKRNLNVKFKTSNRKLK